MNKTISPLRLYLSYVGVILKSTMQYKTSLALTIFARCIVAFGEFFGIYFLFSGFTGMKGYTYGDILLCFSAVQLSFALSECLCGGFKSFAGMVRKGEFDLILARPISPILQVISSKFDLGRTGPMITAVITMFLGVRAAAVLWTPLRILTFFLMIVGGFLLFDALFLIEATCSFFVIGNVAIFNVLTYGAKTHGKYPFDVYGKGVFAFCTYLIPYTLVQYYPLQYLLGRTDNLLCVFAPLGAFVFVLLSLVFWNFGVKKYKSSGS